MGARAADNGWSSPLVRKAEQTGSSVSTCPDGRREVGGKYLLYPTQVGHREGEKLEVEEQCGNGLQLCPCAPGE